MPWPWSNPGSPYDDDAGGGRGEPASGAALSPLSPDQAAALGDEVEAFVQGCLVNYLLAVGRPVPAWAVLNRLAHGSVDDLTEFAATGSGKLIGESEPGEPTWLRAQRSLAAALVTGATRPDDIVGFQRAVLVPLELWFIQRARSEAITSRRVLELASEALADHRPTG
jgi:hypothetical protein